MNLMWDFLTDADNWTGSGGIADRMAEHLGLTLAPLLLAALVALPLGVVVGHGRRGDDLPIVLGALGRLLAPLGVFCYLALKIDTGTDAVLLGLFLLAIPPMITAAYTGIRLVDQRAVESARGAGMMPGQVLREVEIPMAMPDLVAGIRKAARQVVAMAALGAFVGSGGLGRYIVDGQSAEIRDYGQVAAGGLLIAVVAVVLDLLLMTIGRRLTSPGLVASAGSRGRVRDETDPPAQPAYPRMADPPAGPA